ncbi:hypothetical protein [Methylobacterium sp. J-077]|uniref:hypothetical protein n=1 Tax=Methylobacterium sp. J-077 TaxID=2836656 RepID=UPI001FBAC763|nr:hypothetical protein [Methylobacterium sp. J-077]MCJ2122995.1 hypothetical protein [Methylobacterium sp. J-077]
MLRSGLRGAPIDLDEKNSRSCGNKTRHAALNVLERINSKHVNADRCSHRREIGSPIMIKDDLNPPRVGLNAHPILYGVAAGLAALFPPVLSHAQAAVDQDSSSDGDEETETRDGE